ncbi:MAG: hypothetical protein FWH53_06255 [Leptospirales bacterium]|nr:hypothetical protein [Leptospirales bacterium]
MQKELISTDDTYSTVDDSGIAEIKEFSLRMKYLKSELERSLKENHKCSKKQLEFILKRL